MYFALFSKQILAKIYYKGINACSIIIDCMVFGDLQNKFFITRKNVFYKNSLFSFILDSRVAFLSGAGDLELFDAVTQTSKVLVSKDVFVSIILNIRVAFLNVKPYIIYTLQLVIHFFIFRGQ